MHHTTSVHHTSYAHTLTSSAATTSDAPMSINDAAAKKCRFMMIVCWLMFIDVSSKIFYETANYPALERVIGEWITCLIEIGFSLWTIGLQTWTRGVSQKPKFTPFQLSKPGGLGVERVANFVSRCRNKSLRPNRPRFQLPSGTEISSFYYRKGYAC